MILFRCSISRKDRKGKSRANMRRKERRKRRATAAKEEDSKTTGAASLLLTYCPSAATATGEGKELLPCFESYYQTGYASTKPINTITSFALSILYLSVTNGLDQLLCQNSYLASFILLQYYGISNKL